MSEVVPGRVMLDYSNLPPRWRHLAKRILLRAVIGACLLTAGWCGFHFVLPVLVRMHMQYTLQPKRVALFEKNLRHTYPPRTLLFDEATDAVNVPMYSNPQLVSPPRPAARPVAWQQNVVGCGRYWPSPRNASDTTDLYELDSLDANYYSGRVRCAHCLRPVKCYSQYEGSDELFRHAQRSPDGKERLVMIGFDPPAFIAGSCTPFRVQVVTMRGTFRPLLRTHPSEATNFRFICPPSQPLKLYAGQEDPQDESHFTIDYSTPAGEGVIDGWLQPDQTVKFLIRNGPAAQG